MPPVGTGADEKTLVVLQPGYLPWLGFFDQMRRCSTFVLYDDVQYDKGGWRNRNRIKSKDGPLWLTVPVLTKRRFGQRLLDVEIDTTRPWARSHLRSVRQCYAMAPYIDRYLPELSEVLSRPWDRLVELDIALIALMADWLGLERHVVRSSEVAIRGSGSERLVELCRHFGATHYLTGDAARAYLDMSLFVERGITVHWHGFRHPTYPQQHGEFVPYLSTVDLVLNCGDAARDVLNGRAGG